MYQKSLEVNLDEEKYYKICSRFDGCTYDSDMYIFGIYVKVILFGRWR